MMSTHEIQQLTMEYVLPKLLAAERRLVCSHGLQHSSADVAAYSAVTSGAARQNTH
jgi:hypothetical protein